MPLIDRLLDQAASPHGAIALRPIAQAALDAEHFVFDIETKTALAGIAHGNPSSLVAAMPLCRLPFARCWFEWPGDVVAGMERRLDPTADQAIPKTIGVLLESATDSPTAIRISFVWEFRDASAAGKFLGGVVVSMVSLAADWGDSPDPRIVEAARSVVTVDPIYLQGRATKEKAPAELLATRMITQKCPYVEEIGRAMRRRDPDGLLKLIEASSQDVIGEHLYVMAALALINSRNCVAIKPIDVSTLNKARIKGGKRPLVSYSTVKIVLSRADQRAAGVRGLSREEMRRHVVRGHFKVKKKGIYWWRPHIRGSLGQGEVRRAGYEVTTSSSAKPKEA